MRRGMKIAVAGIATLLIAGGAVSAHAQQAPINADDPLITRKPRVGPGTLMPDYPIAAVRERAAGQTTLSLCVDASGESHSPTIARSSGSEALDQAALAWLADDALFTPGEIDGKSVDVCNYTLAVDWRMPGPDDWMMPPAGPPSFRDIFPDVSALREENRPILLKAAPQNLPYPPAALAAGSEGPVIYSLCLDASGMVVDIKLNTPDVHPDLSTMALSWLWSVKFSPAMRNGRRAAVCGVEVTYTWRLPDAAAP
jgi:TonB family protein